MTTLENCEVRKEDKVARFDGNGKMKQPGV
jgi:hypothetical protein